MRLNQTLCITGIWIVNLNTLWFVKPSSQNLFYLGSALHTRWHLVLWTTSVALYFYIYTRKWMAPLEYRNRLGWFVLSLSCLGVVFLVLLPYAPYVHATLSRRYIHFAIGSTILYVSLIFHIPCEPLTRDIAAFQKVAGPYAMLVVFELLLYPLNGGVSTLFEIYFPMTMSLYLYTVNSPFSRRNRFSK